LFPLVGKIIQKKIQSIYTRIVFNSYYSLFGVDMKKLSVIFILLSFCSILYGLPDKTEFSDITIYHNGEREDTLREIDQMISKIQSNVFKYFEIVVGKREMDIYSNQKKMQRQKHPIISAFAKLDWYIGDNSGERILIVSPNTKVKGHSYSSIINAIPHEYIHTIIFSINPKCPLWINEGVALYLSNRQKVSTRTTNIPPMKILKSNNSLYFQKNNGYGYADKFIEFIEDEYGHGKVIELIKEGSYEDVLGKSLGTIHSEWIEYLKRSYP